MVIRRNHKSTTHIASRVVCQSASLSSDAIENRFDPSEIHQDEEALTPTRTTTPVSGFWDPRSQLRVYNDSLPASSQPQTPQNLPEARHQGRPNGSYTAPARRSSPPPAWTPTVTRSRTRFGQRREPSPMRLRTLGPGGQYGGMVNVDDEAVAEGMAHVPSRPGAAA
ncbi:uncharacterized protein C8A04DRAFT_29564 [Dichotomopilus funicola]|uniref:Uncharacterized protein n=1 Tax=Dichotomopilus funicola TaxID=1934379 RepID=A0AAN6V1P6_9PEZI|nr:hypothetical protein C8A04DRAFT_29564 [Dichotomopilus funicola]